jgi:two-component system, NtrC family, sensor kinase
MVAAGSYWALRSILLKTIKDAVFLQLKEQSETLDQWLAQNMANVQSIANTPTVRSLQWTTIQPYFDQEVARTRTFSSLTFAYPDGRYYNSYIGNRVWKNGGSIADRPYFKQVMAGNANISDPFISRSMGMTSIAIASPIWQNSYRSQQPVGEVHAQVSLEHVAKVIQNLNYGKGSYAFMLNSKGEPIVHPNPKLISTLEKPTPSFRQHPDDAVKNLAQRMATGAEGMVAVRIAGEPKYVGYMGLKAAPWSIAVIIPPEQIESQLVSLNLLALLLGTLPLLTAAIAWRQWQLLKQAQHQRVEWATQEQARHQAEQQLQQRYRIVQQQLSQLKQNQQHLLRNQVMANFGRLVMDLIRAVNAPTQIIQSQLNVSTQQLNALQTHLAQLSTERTQQRSPIALSVVSEATQTITQLQQALSLSQINGDRLTQISQSLDRLTNTKQTEWTNLNQLLDQVLHLLEHRFARQSNRPTIRILRQYQTLPPIHCAPGAIQQVLIHLLNNAIEAIAYRFDQGAPIPHPCIRIRTQVSTQGHMLIRITDNGCGIPETDQARIFTPFFSTKSPTQFNGLGLFICQTIIHQQGGAIRYVSIPASGCDFIIELPQHPNQAISTAVAATPPRRSSKPRKYALK